MNKLRNGMFEVPRSVGYEDELFRLGRVLFEQEVDEKYIAFGQYVYDIFELRSFLWDCDFDCEEDGEENKDISKCKIDNWCEKPNFYYKPTDLKIYWYKYPLRSAECNQNISLSDFVNIINRCIESYVNCDCHEDFRDTHRPDCKLKGQLIDRSSK